MTDNDLRTEAVDDALALVGLTAPSPDYAAIICTEGDDPAALCAMSGCGLLVRGRFRRWLWRRCGIIHPRLGGRPYVVGEAVADVVAVAREAGAYRGPTYDYGAGDVVVLGAPEHVLTVVQRAGAMVASVDGGQRTGEGAETVTRRERRAGPGTLDGRPIEGVVDWVAFARKYLAATQATG